MCKFICKIFRSLKRRPHKQEEWEFVLNMNDRKIHHIDCEWVDNIKYPKKVTRKKAQKLLLEGEYKLAACCVKKGIEV